MRSVFLILFGLLVFGIGSAESLKSRCDAYAKSHPNVLLQVVPTQLADQYTSEFVLNHCEIITHSVSYDESEHACYAQMVVACEKEGVKSFRRKLVTL